MSLKFHDRVEVIGSDKYICINYHKGKKGIVKSLLLDGDKEFVGEPKYLNVTFFRLNELRKL